MALSKEEQERYKKRWTNRNNNSGTATGTGNSGTTGSNASGLSESEKNRYAERWNSRHDLDQTYIDTFFNESNEFLTRVQSDYNKLDYKSATADSSLDYYKSLRQTESDLSTRAQKVQSYLNTRKDKMDEEEYKKLSSYLSNFTSPQFSQKFFDARDYYSQWDSEDAYNQAVAQQKDYEEKKTADIGKLQWELEELEEYRGLDRWYKMNRSVNADDPKVGEMLARYRDLQQKYGTEDLDKLISEKSVYINNASRIQKGVELASVVDTDPEFSQYAGYVDSDKMPVIPDYEDLVYGTINGSQDAKNGRTMATAWSKLSDIEKDRLNALQYMSDEEKALYNYYYNKHGYDAAEEYLDSIIDGLNYIRGEEMFQSLKGNTVAEMLFGIGAGFDQANSGLQSLFSGKDYIPTSSTQYASGMVREDLAGSKVGQVAYDLITTGANMAPSILTSIAVGVINPAAGALAGNAMMGASAAGNAYASMINSGYDKDSASLYAASIGASEVVLGQLIGGISKLGGITPALEKALSGIDNGIARFALEYGGKMVSEGIEEGLQEILDPILQNAILHADEDIDWGEVAYSALLGGLSAGVMEGPGMVVGAVTDAKLNKNAVKQYGEFTGDLIQEGLLSDPSSESYQLAQKFQKRTEGENGKSMTGRQIRQLVEANDAQFAVEDYNSAVATAKEKLTELGETKDIENISKLVAKKATGQELTRVEKSTLARSDYGAKVAKEMTTPTEQTDGSAKAYNVTYKSITERVGEEGRYGVAESGETTLRNENEAVRIAEVVTIDDGQMTVKLDDGREVYAGDIDFASDDESRLYSAVADMEHMTPAAATALVHAYDPASEQSVTDYVNGIDEAYTYGYYGYAEADLKAGNFTSNLTSEQMMSAYRLGQSAKKIGIVSNNDQIVKMRTAAEAKAAPKNATVTKKDLSGSDAAVYFMDGKATRKFDESGKYDDKRMAGVNYAKFLSKLGIGSKYYFYESYIKDGKRVYKDANGNEVNAPNGFYKTNDGSIYIDLNAGDKGDGFTLYTLGHELTHFIKQWSEAKFQVLADFLIEEYGKTDMSMHQRVLEKQSQLEKTRGEKVSYDEAFEEVVADSMSTMLSDGNLHEKLAKLKAQDKGLFNKIKKFFEQLVAKFKKVYAELTPDQKDAQDVQQMKDAFDRIQTAFAEALVEASENFQASLTPGVESIVANEAGDPVAYSTEDGSVMLSIRTYEENGRTELRKYLDKCVSSNQLTKAEMQEMIDGIEEIYNICKEFKDKYAPFSSWSDAAVVRDTHGRPVFSVVTPNGDYKMNLDFSLVCKKRRTLDAVFNEMSKRGIIDDFELGQKSVVKINEIIRSYGLETACALCFVDAKRFRQASMADSFTSLYNELVMSLVPEDKHNSIGHFNFAGYETIKAVENGIHTWKASDLDFSHLDYVMKNYASGTVEHKAAKYIKANAEGRKLLLRGDFMSSKGFDAVKTQNQSILKLYNAKKGTGGPKAAFGDVQYLNEIVKKARTWTPAKAYEVGGVRIQSFSDYVPRMVFDYVQMIYDLAATKLPAHAYTKEALFVKQFGLTGVKINMSLIPAIADGGIAPGLDAKGNYVWAGESFDFETAKQIQNAEGYSENCGTICVGVSDLHIRKLLNDPNIRMVIPYHKSGLNPIVAHMNKIAAFNDYTNDQRTKGADGKALEKDFDFNKALHDMGANGDPKAVVQQYLDWCDENGYTAKFSQFRDHANYYKLLEDFTVYDKDGNYVPQREVRAVFPKDGSAFGSMKELIESGLEEDAIVEGKRDSSLSSIVDEIQRTLPKTEAEISEEQVAQADHDLEGVKRSDRDSQGNTLSEDQKEYFADSKARDENGNLYVLYHGSRSPIFTEFDLYEGVWLTPDANYAEAYADWTDDDPTGLESSVYDNPNSRIYKMYANITNPLDLGEINDDFDSTHIDRLAKLLGVPASRIEAIASDYGYKYGVFVYEVTRTKEFIDIAREKGYDGFVATEAGNKTFCAIGSPNQVKLTTNEVPSGFSDIRYSDRTNPYSYEALVSKPDMNVTTVDGNVPNNRADVVYQAKQNAAKVGKLDPKTGSVSVHVKDIGVDVVIGTPGLKHGLEARRAENAIVTVKAGEILSNSIRINELTPKKADAKSSYVLIGTAQGNDGSFYIVRSVVNSFSNVLASMDVLYAINAKKGNRLRSMRPGFQGPVTDSTITIAELLDIVNQYFPDVLPESVLKHYGHDTRPDGLLGTDALYSERTGDYGYHAGDLGKAESLQQQGLGRDTGHFGTGTYFVGNKAAIDGYNTRNGKPAPVETVDFSKYNLFKPKNADDGFALHKFLHGVDGYWNRDADAVNTMEEYESLQEKLSELVYDIESEEFGETDPGKESWMAVEREFLSDAKRMMGDYKVGNALTDTLNGLTDGNFHYDSRNKEYYSYDLDTDQETYYAEDEIIQKLNAEEGGWRAFEGIEKLADEYYSYSRTSRYETWSESIKDVAKILGISEQEVRNVIRGVTEDIYSRGYTDEDMKTADSAATRFMKALGYEGIDVRGIKALDNTGYGSVIYDLKGEDLARKNEIGTARFSERTGDSVSNRNLLANAFEGIVQNSIEYEMLQDYKDRIKALNKLEAKLSDLNREIRKIRFTEGEYDAKKLRELESEAKKVAQEINRHDWKLLNLEASEPLRRVIDRERKKEAQKTRDHVKQIQQNKKDRAEQTELRQKIRKKVRDLDKLLNRGNKKLNVKEDMKGFVSKALELADYLFTDHVSNDELIRKGITVRMTQREAALVKETEEILSKIYDHADSLTDEEFTRLDAKRKANEDKLRDLLTAQRNERLQTPVYNLFSDLVTEYSAFKNSKQDAVKAAYNPEVERFLRTYVGDEDSDRAKTLKNMRVADMTTEELWKLDNAYQMVLHAVRTANKLFVNGNNTSIEQMVTEIVMEFGSRKIPEKKMAIAMQKLGNKIGWDYEKLYYALDRIGSKAFTDLIMNLANSENIVMQDVMEAAEFRDRMVEKYGFNNWDVNKEIDHEFLDHTGKKFKLTLGQLMSLYAYSRREGAWDHIEYGGFVFGEAALTNPKPADSFKLSKEQCEAITGTLTKEQKSYVEDMQKFLSETMGGKGNEVSMMLYGIKMFGEKNYFPIHIAGQFKAQAQESQAKHAAGFGSMSNAGFTHAQNPQAKAPFVLEGFNDVWSDHVNEMSRYHGTVPALEDLRRVMNRSSYSENTAESTSVKVIMENHYGKEAVEYFDNLYREANSGAITDKLQHTSKKLLSLFRKNSVAYSLSVLVQQPASLVRAYAVIDRKYFGFKGVGAITSGVAKAVSSKWNKAYENAYTEMLKYAPGVTMTKEIGGFDTATGGSIRSYLLDTDKSFKQKWKTGTAKEKGKAVLDVVDDNAIANLPNVADKIAWIEIWNACKRETLAKHKDLAPTSEAFMKIVGDRFTEVIRATQVYDSIFAKSPMLKSKNLAVQMLVSFMNEPNTVANMAESAVRDFTKGNRMDGLKKAHVLIHSIIFTGVLKSLIYAMRDDDEDETYIEKYIESLTGSLMDDFNLLNYIPIARDVWSVAQGYDVERADMAIVADAISALNKVIKTATTDRDGMTEDELVELDKKVTEASWTLAESLAAFVGVPMKNIRREINAMIDHAKIASANAGKTTAMSTWDTISEAVIDSIPFMGGKSKTDKLYAAIIEGDTEYTNRLKATYKTEDSYHTAVRKALRENDPRIKEAAQAHINGDPSKRVSIAKQIIADGFILDDVVAAINTEINAMSTSDSGSDTKKEKGVYTAADIAIEAANGDWASVDAIKDDIIQTSQKNGKTKDEAEDAFVSTVQSNAKEAYFAGSLNDAAAKKLLAEYAGKDEDEAAETVRYWAFCRDNPAYKDFSKATVGDYYEFAEPANISLDVYAQYVNGTAGLATIYDQWGDEVKSKREQVLEVIDSLPITLQQKDALYLAAGYAESKIWDVPW